MASRWGNSVSERSSISGSATVSQRLGKSLSKFLFWKNGLAAFQEERAPG
jgi:hypothetical protein